MINLKYLEKVAADIGKKDQTYWDKVNSLFEAPETPQTVSQPQLKTNTQGNTGKLQVPAWLNPKSREKAELDRLWAGYRNHPTTKAIRAFIDSTSKLKRK